MRQDSTGCENPPEDKEEQKKNGVHLHKPYRLLWIFRLSFGYAYVKQIQTSYPIRDVSPVSGMQRLMILGAPRVEKLFSRHAVDPSRLWRRINQKHSRQGYGLVGSRMNNKVDPDRNSRCLATGRTLSTKRDKDEFNENTNRPFLLSIRLDGSRQRF
jgi:hypothetical protein